MRQKKLSKQAGLTIPKDMRLEAGIMPGGAVDIVPVRDGLLVRRHIPTCRMCGVVENVLTVQTMGGKETEICRMCATQIAHALHDDGGQYA